MIAFVCQSKNLVEKLTILSKVPLGSMKSLAPISVRVNDKTNLCELCLCFDSNYKQHSTYIDYYANVDIITSQGNGMFVIPSFIEVLNTIKNIEPDGYIVTRFENDKVIISHDDEIIFEGYSNVPDDSHIQLLNTFEFEKEIQLPSALLDYTSNLLKVISRKKDSQDARFNSIVFNKNPLQSNSLVVMRTDSIRLMYYPISLVTEWPFGCIVIPEDVMSWVSKLKKKKNKIVSIKIHEHALSLEYDEYRVVCLVDKKFLPVEDFIKADVDCVLTVSTESFIKAVESANAGDGKNVVTIKAKNQEMEVFMYSYMQTEELRKIKLNCVLDGCKEFDFSIYGSQLFSLLKLCGETVSIHKLSMKQIYLITSVGKDFQYIIIGVKF
jgi:hypothetical protein